MSIIRRIANGWHRWSLRRHQYRGGAAVLDALYAQADPWNLASDEERTRFEATNALIQAHCPTVSSLIEIGCGEGMQTGYLSGLAQHVTGIDISDTALARAKMVVPDATLLAGDLAALLPDLPRPHYDVATLCEVLYYMPDPAGTLACAQQLADHVVVTIYTPQARRLAPLLAGQGWQPGPVISAGRKQWNSYVWNRADLTPSVTERSG